MGKAFPDTPLNGRPQHLIEAAKQGHLDQMLFFPAPLTTRAPLTTTRPDDWLGVWPDVQPDVQLDVRLNARPGVRPDGRRRRPRRQWRRKKHLIEAAPFGCLDQMLKTAVQSSQRGVWQGHSQKAKYWGVRGQRPS